MRKKQSSLSWWSTNYKNELSIFVQELLSIIPTSGATERCWRICGRVHSKERNRLNNDKIDKLIYIYMNERLRNRYKQYKTTKKASKSDIINENSNFINEQDQDINDIEDIEDTIEEVDDIEEEDQDSEDIDDTIDPIEEYIEVYSDDDDIIELPDDDIIDPDPVPYPYIEKIPITDELYVNC